MVKIAKQSANTVAQFRTIRKYLSIRHLITNLKHSIMKTIIKLSLVVLATLTTIGSYANGDDFLLNVKNRNGKQISFSVNQIQRATVRIFDANHEIIYTESLTGKEGLTRIYSLEEFPDGLYYLEVETNLKRVTHKIQISDEMPSLSKRSIAEVYKGELKIKRNALATTN